MTYSFRDYQPGDREACLTIFDAATPDWFAPFEREQFEAFLDNGPETYFVLVDGTGVVAGSGGIEIEPSRRTAWLTWGMVDPARHGQGLGRLQLEHRLELLRGNGQVDRVCIDTSNKTAPFFERHGFVAQRIIPDGYAKGLHRHEMTLRFDYAAVKAATNGPGSQ